MQMTWLSVNNILSKLQKKTIRTNVFGNVTSYKWILKTIKILHFCIIAIGNWNIKTNDIQVGINHKIFQINDDTRCEIPIQ